jgi:ABC-type anion transport system duplicated permease subunit
MNYNMIQGWLDLPQQYHKVRRNYEYYKTCLEAITGAETTPNTPV